MNRLHQESSPYLQQHADNPVDWYPWKEEALQRAVREDKPILLSIGYSTCHWCHVMERESFQDESVAAYMNDHFINIKVDREERPDLDQFFMEACQILSGQAGWPLNIFLTPERKPFFGGTYFPPEKEGRRLSWFQALQYAAYNFYENRKAVNNQAEKVLWRMQQGGITGSSELGETPATVLVEEWKSLLPGLLKQIRQKLDLQYGGFGQGQKYPNSMALEFLLSYAGQMNEAEIAKHVTLNLDQMLRGGIYDIVGGGFCRYATDRQWRVPHFEKMLYDNALLVSLLAGCYQHRPDVVYENAIRKTLTFIERELSNGKGGFFSALDADTNGIEGAFYTWTKEEIDSTLGTDAALFCDLFDIREEGNWEKRRNILQLTAVEHLRDADDFLEKSTRRLATVRAKRKRPARDEKMLLAWNALQAMAYMDAYAALGEVSYKNSALKSLQFIAQHFEGNDFLIHSIIAGQTDSPPGFLSDYAFYIQALIKAYSLEWDAAFLRSARHWMELAIEKFYDEKSYLFFFSEKSNTELPFSGKDTEDAEIPSAGAVMADNLKRLSLIFGNKHFEQIAYIALKQIQNKVVSNTFPMASWARLLVSESIGWKELAITGPEAFYHADQVKKWYLPGFVIMASEEATAEWPLLQYRYDAHQTRFFLCEQYSCKAPYFTINDLKEELFS